MCHVKMVVFGKDVRGRLGGNTATSGDENTHQQDRLRANHPAKGDW